MQRHPPDWGIICRPLLPNFGRKLIHKMPLAIKYIPLYSKNIETEIAFFVRYFNLIDAGKIRLSPDVEGALLKLDVNKELYLLVLPEGFAPDDAPPDFKVIINTDDCLKEYLWLKSNGFEFEGKPYNLPAGLAASFNVEGGARYMLLEERDYNQPYI